MFDLRYFSGERYFDDDGSQNGFVFQPIFKTLQHQLVVIKIFQKL